MKANIVDYKYCHMSIKCGMIKVFTDHHQKNAFNETLYRSITITGAHLKSEQIEHIAPKSFQQLHILSNQFGNDDGEMEIMKGKLRTKSLRFSLREY